MLFLSNPSMLTTEIVCEAEEKWVLKNDFNIIQKLAGILPKKYCLQLQ